ncbi:MAG TPA: HEAT repeat domain-containing protein [Ktedonobacterales bacterium]
MALWGGPNIPRLEREHNVTELLAALKHKRANTRVEAAGALGRLRDAAAVEPLCALLHDADPLVRKAAAEAIGACHDPRAVEPLGQALIQEKDSAALDAIVTALGGIQDPRALDLLVTAFKMGGQARESAEKQLERLRAVDQLITLLADRNEQSGFARSLVARSLGKIGDLRATEALITALADPEWDVQWEAGITLAQFADPRSGPPYSEDTKGHERWKERWSAIRSYGSGIFARPEFAKIVAGSNTEKGLVAAISDPEPLIHKFGGLALGHSVSRLPRAVPELLVTAVDEQLMPANEVALRKEQVGAAAVDAITVPLLAWVRKTALDLLLQREPPAHLEEVLNAFLSNEDKTVQAVGAAGLKLLHERMAESQNTAAATGYREHIEQLAQQFGVTPVSKEALQTFNPANIPPEVTGNVVAYQYLVQSGAKTRAEAADTLTQALRQLGASERYIADATQYAVDGLGPN